MAAPEPAPLQGEASGLGRTASTGGGATAALLQPAGHTHTDLLATPQDARPSPGSRSTPARDDHGMQQVFAALHLSSQRQIQHAALCSDMLSMRLPRDA